MVRKAEMALQCITALINTSVITQLLENSLLSYFPAHRVHPYKYVNVKGELTAARNG